MQTHFFVDIHCHPTIKAYARSFKDEPGDQSANPKNNTSVWYRDAPSNFDKIKQYLFGLTNFIQSDASSLLKGRVAIVCLSFYPQEKAFFKNKAGERIISDTLTMLATEFGKQRIDHLQNLESYWEDLKAEMKFILKNENIPVKIYGIQATYSIVRSYADIELADRKQELGNNKILFIPSIEGAHIFDQMMNSYEAAGTYEEGIPKERLDIVLRRIADLRSEKDGMLRPLFITFAHHFWNGLCGQARSLGGVIKCVVDQENGLSLGFTTAGYQSAKALLDKQLTAEGKEIPRIIIDIKHMSRKSREDYFVFLEANYLNAGIPILSSHGGVTGLSKPGGERVTPASQEGIFMEDDINLFDDEILMIEKTKGLFGVQLDERRIGSKQALRNARHHIARRDILYAWSKLVWNQIRHIAEVLDMNGRYAWGIQCLGTDFDGIIDPINGYWTAKELDHLDDYILKHAFNYLMEIDGPCPLKSLSNRQIKAEEVVDRFMTSNALNFFAQHMP